MGLSYSGSSYQTTNPAMRRSLFMNPAYGGSSAMTLSGTLGKTLVLFALCAVSGGVSGSYIAAHPADTWVLWVGLIGGLVLAIATRMRIQWAPVTAPLYAIFEGVVLGTISVEYEALYGGIVAEALFCTGAAFLVMLGLYGARILKPTRRFRSIVMCATGAICLYYAADIVVSFFHPGGLPLINSDSPLGIAFSVVVVIVAALNLVTDFGIIEVGIERQAPKYMEWYGGFALLVTVVWLYIEMLQLLSKLRSR